MAVVDAEHGLQRLAVEPSAAHDAMLIGRGAGHQAGHGTGTVGVKVGVFGLRVNASVRHQAGETTLTVEGHESLQTIAAQLVDDHIHHQPGHLRCHLSVHLHHGQQGHKGGQETVSVSCHAACVL